MFEHTPGGAIVPGYNFKVLDRLLWQDIQLKDGKLKVLEGESSTWTAPHQVYLEVVVYLFVLKNLVLELWNWGSIKWRYGTSMPYITNIWNVLEVINIIPFFFSITARVTFIYDPVGALYSVFVGRYQELGNLAEMYSSTFVLDSISILVSVVKYFKYLRLSEATNMLWSTLSRAARDMVGCPRAARPLPPRHPPPTCSSLASSSSPSRPSSSLRSSSSSLPSSSSACRCSAARW